MAQAGKDFQKLTEIVDRLMGEDGCPWDRVQTRETLKPYLVEECYETLEALDTNEPEKIKDELGDLMYQILFHSKISEQNNEFGIPYTILGCSSEKKYLIDAVKYQLMSDAKIGCFLSGGIDSTILSFISNLINKNIETYSINFNQFNDVFTVLCV